MVSFGSCIGAKAPWKPYGTLNGSVILATGSLEKFFASITRTCTAMKKDNLSVRYKHFSNGYS